MTDYYVDPAASGANDGSSWTDAWTSLQTALDTVTAGNTIYCRGTQTLAATTDIDTNSGSGASGWIKVIGCNSGGTVDGTRFILDGNSAAANCLLLDADQDWLWFENIELKNATSHGFSFSAGSDGPLVSINCLSHSNGGAGFYGYYSTVPNTHFFFRCCAKDNGEGGFDRFYYGGIFVLCSALDNTEDGFEGGSDTSGRYNVCIGCISHSNGEHGFDESQTGSGNLYFLCTSDENDDDGINHSGAIVAWVLGCRLTNNGLDTSGYGINEDGSGRVVYGFNFLIDNDSGATNGSVDALPMGSDSDTNETSGTEGYTDGGNDDFSLTDSATLRRTAISVPTG